ncbi:sensor histidine kinase [Erysipelothrix inopinata]|uniref:Sensor histidine kinase n=1 Tax=Erysipelothrix inopinata TaxID=225084 RepID=A0A7G9RZJ0_9FIRM|nr:sensor histidine kinase [Erysipelothrix inopinata]QNN61015.1 sensor histidine kinase [Erysipelothrix inopinata]
MKQLIHTYAMVLIAVIMLFTFLVSYATTQSDRSDVNNQLNQITRNVTTAMGGYQTDLRRMVLELFPDQVKIDSMLDYFYMDFSKYYTQQLELPQFQLFPRDVEKLYDRYDGIRGFVVTLDATGDIFYSSSDNKMGYKPQKLPDISKYMIFTRPIMNFESYKAVGNLYVLMDYEVLDDLVYQERFMVEPIVFLLSPTGNIQYEYNTGNGIELREEILERYKTREPLDSEMFDRYSYQQIKLSDGTTLIVAARNYDIFMKSFNTYAFTIMGGLFLVGVLLFVLFKTFGRYDDQVRDILGTMESVRTGSIDDRIAVDNKEGELFTISSAINETLDSMNRYIKQIYQMEIRQQDINMRALQSQINAHFLYNTLEFIRMYAVAEGVDELADIVFTFSTLLRNNISLEKTTTLAKELEFVEKYVYLHQMRYPNKIAYKFDVAENFEMISIPKFTLQPLIENYFVHGVNYRRVDNAIKVNVYKENKRIHIRVSDNGKGVDDDTLKAIQLRLEESEFDLENDKSVGLVNVHERLKVFFKDQDYRFEVGRSENGGFAVLISFIEEDSDV